MCNTSWILYNNYLHREEARELFESGEKFSREDTKQERVDTRIRFSEQSYDNTPGTRGWSRLRDRTMAVKSRRKKQLKYIQKETGVGAGSATLKNINDLKKIIF